MKKILAASLIVLLSIGIVTASGIPSPSSSSVNTASISSRVNFPTGNFFNGTNFVKVESTWARVVIRGEMEEFDIVNSERDPYGNYVLILQNKYNRTSLTIYSDGRSLYYDGETYTKR